MATIQGVYVALFGRPADPTGLNYFNSVTNNGADLTAIGDLSSTAEYQARFAGQSNAQIITSIYQSLFDRNPEQAGLDFFVAALANGTFNINNIAIAILDGAQGDDKTLVDKKIAAADLYTAAIDTPDEIAAYQGTSAANSGIAFLEGVTATSTVVDAAAAQAAVSGLPIGVNPGQTFTLTTKSGEQIAGTAGDDTVNAILGKGATLNTFDELALGGGNDTLNAVAKSDLGKFSFSATQVKGVETVKIANDAAAQTGNINTAALTELKTLNIAGSKAVAAVTLGKDQSLTLGNAAAKAIKVNLAKTDTSSSVSLTNGPAAAKITILGTKVATTTTLDGANGAKVNLIDANATTVNLGLTGKGALNLDLAKATTLDASKSTGALTYDVKGSKALTTVKLGSGKDTMVLDTNTIKVKSVDLGAGNDTFTQFKTNVKSTITGGTGKDTITLAGKIGDTIVINKGDSGITVATADVIKGFKTKLDKLDFNLAKGSKTNYLDGGKSSSFVDGLTNANTAFASNKGKLQYFETKAGGVNTLFIDQDLDGDADMAVVLGASDIVFGDIIA